LSNSALRISWVAQASHQWGLYTPDKLFAGSVVAAGAVTLIAQVGGEQALTAGDVVAAAALAGPLPDYVAIVVLGAAQVKVTAADGAVTVGRAHWARSRCNGPGMEASPWPNPVGPRWHEDILGAGLEGSLDFSQEFISIGESPLSGWLSLWLTTV